MADEEWLIEHRRRVAQFPEDFADPDDESTGTTAICPRCEIDSVIGDRSGFEPAPELLQKMNQYWF